MGRQRKSLSPAKILVLGFIIVILAGTVLLSLPHSVNGTRISLIDALFTATSAVCVTGLVVVDTGTFFSPLGQSVIMILIFVGSLGFMTMATLIFVFLGKRVFLREKLVLREALNSDTLEGITRLVGKIVVIAVVMELAGALLLSFYFVPELGYRKGIFYAVFHAISAFGNAGFDLMGDFQSLTAVGGNFLVTGTIMVLFFVGGLGFPVLLELIQYPRHPRFTLHARMVFRVTILLLILGWLSILIMEYRNPDTLGAFNGPQKAVASLFTALTPRTAGFSVVNMGALNMSTMFFIIALMFIGASPASTGGGIKTTTFGVLVVAVIALTRGREEPVIGERRIPVSLIFKAVVIILGSIALIFVTTLILTLAEEAEFMHLIFEAVSAFGTVGLSAGITPELSAAGKAALIVTMFVGRLGPLTLLFSLSGRQKSEVVYFPHEKVLIG